MTSRVKVILDAPNRGRVWIDGEELSNVTDIAIRAGVDRPTTAVIELSNIEVEAHASAKVSKKKAKRAKKPARGARSDLETK